jgi:hypothetical protein
MTAIPDRELREHLRGLVSVCESTLRLLDEEMKKPSDAERGKRIAAICNRLELQKDMAKRFGLGVGLPPPVRAGRWRKP